mgnify:CR=1 FL=1
MTVVGDVSPAPAVSTQVGTPAPRGVGLVLSVVVCVGIEFVPGDHGDSGDGLAWLGVMVLLDVVPFWFGWLAALWLMLLLLDDRKTR